MVLIKVVDKIKTHFVFNKFLFSKIVNFFETMQKNAVQPEGPRENIIRRIRTACWITKPTHTNMICITAFLRQQRLRERALILPSVWGARVVSISFPE
jgi:hypothetical protein